MTLSKLMRLYRHYQDMHDFKIKGGLFEDAREQFAHQGEWFPE